jgi:hypothetical protein
MSNVISKLATVGVAIAVLAAGTLTPRSAAAKMGVQVDGRWVSTRGALALVFQDGSFTTRRSKTSEVLVRGSYDVSGNQLTMRWYSPVTQQEVTARCTQWGAKSMLCDQPGRGELHIQRVD